MKHIQMLINLDTSGIEPLGVMSGSGTGEQRGGDEPGDRSGGRSRFMCGGRRTSAC